MMAYQYLTEEDLRYSIHDAQINYQRIANQWSCAPTPEKKEMLSKKKSIFLQSLESLIIISRFTRNTMRRGIRK